MRNSEFILKKKAKDKEFSAYKVFKQLLSYVQNERKRLIFGIFCSLFNAIFYVLGSIYIGYVFRNYFEVIFTSADPNLAIANFDIFHFSIDLIILGGAFILYGCFRYAESLIYIRISYNQSARMRQEVMEKLIKMPISYYDKQKAGDLISTMINDINNVSNTLMNTLNQFFSSFFNVVISISIMFMVSTILTLIAVPMSLILFGLSLLVIKRAQPYFVKVQDSFGKLNAFVEENIANMKVTNSFDREKLVFDQLKLITQEIKRTACKGDLTARSVDPWFGFTSYSVNLVVAAIAVALYFAKVNVYGLSYFGSNQNGTASGGLIITFIALNWNFMGPFNTLLNINFSLQVGIASSNRIFKLLNLNPDKDHAEEIFLYKIVGEIEFKNVFFRYNKNSKKYQLNNASFTVKPGQTVAIVGPTGAGKTTIVNLLSKFYDYESGSITIDSHELRHIDTENLRNLVSVVLQDSFLFNDTIKWNLTMGNENVTDEQIIEAAKLTGAEHFINQFPEKYNTKIENNGTNLSQGQRQLLNITRAILANRNMLILDEATSNVDSQTEKVIQNSLLKLMENKTSFIIAHRLSTIKNADIILVVDNGYIIEKGTHQELLKQKGFYYNLYSSSFK